jgi:hypothetical protein
MRDVYLVQPCMREFTSGARNFSSSLWTMAVFSVCCSFCSNSFVVCFCYVATRSLVTFVSSVLEEGALECDHNL